MIPLILAEIAIAAGAAYLVMGGTAVDATITGMDAVMPGSGNNKWGLPDTLPEIQKGGYSTVFDQAIQTASQASGVPFALIKAHALRESSLNDAAYHFDNNTVGASYGLMQVEWIQGSNRFSKYGVDDSTIGSDGSGLYDPTVNTLIGAYIIRDNLDWLKGNLRDAINAYNTGTAESGVIAPKNYVNDVIAYYSKIVGGPVA